MRRVACVLLVFAGVVAAQSADDYSAAAPPVEDAEDEPPPPVERLDAPMASSDPPAATRAAASADAGSDGGAASVQFMITHRMRAQLADLGYSEKEIKSLQPERARVLIAKQIKRTSRGVPKAWQRKGGSPSRRGPDLKRWLGTVTLAATAVYVADPELANQLMSNGRAWIRGVLHSAKATGAARSRPAVRRS